MSGKVGKKKIILAHIFFTVLLSAAVVRGQDHIRLNAAADLSIHIKYYNGLNTFQNPSCAITWKQLPLSTSHKPILLQEDL